MLMKLSSTCVLFYSSPSSLINLLLSCVHNIYIPVLFIERGSIFTWKLADKVERDQVPFALEVYPEDCSGRKYLALLTCVDGKSNNDIE